MTDKKFNKKLTKLLKKQYGDDFIIANISHGFRNTMNTKVINGEIFSGVFTIEAKVQKLIKDKA